MDTARTNHVRNLLRLRRFWLNVHLWFGLTLGTLLAMFALTGTVIGLWEEIYEWTNPAYVVPKGPDGYAPLDDVLDTVRAAHPQRAASWELWLPRTEHSVIYAIYGYPEEKPGAYAAALMIAIDPNTAQIIDTWYWSETWLTVFYNLHAFLALGKAGEVIVGLSGFLTFVSLGTGLYLWWPMGRFRRSSFTIAADGDPARLEFDLHRLIGVYTLAVTAVIALTGSMLVYSQSFGSAISVFSPVQNLHPHVQSAVAPGARPISISRAVDIAAAVFPRARLKRVYTPALPQDAWRIVLHQPEETINESHTYTQVWVDQFSGSVLHRIDPTGFNAGTALLSWRVAFHNGEVFGLPGKLAVSALGIVLFVLYVTGLMQWLRRRRIQSLVSTKTGAA